MDGRMTVSGASLLLAFVLGGADARGQTRRASTREELAKDNKLFLDLARKELHWEEPAEPVKIVGPLYFVGTRGLGAWLFATSEGLILLNTGMASSAQSALADCSGRAPRALQPTRSRS